MGIGLVVLGVLLGSLLIVAAFTPIGLLAAPVGIGLIVIGALRIDRASRRVG